MRSHTRGRGRVAGLDLGVSAWQRPLQALLPGPAARVGQYVAAGAAPGPHPVVAVPPRWGQPSSSERHHHLPRPATASGARRRHRHRHRPLPPVGCPGPCGVQRSESADNTPVRSFLKHSLLHSVSASTVLTQSNFSLSSLASSVRSSKLMIDVIRETLEWPGPESAASTGEGTHGGRKKASVYSVSTDASYRSSQVAATTHGDFESNCGAVQAKPKMKLSCCAVS